MKNLLLTTTALATLFAGVAMGASVTNDALTVTLGGELETQAGFRSQGAKYTKATAEGLNAQKQSGNASSTVFKRGLTPGNDNVAFDTVTAIHATVKGKTEFGTLYGAQIGIQATNLSKLPAGQNGLDRTFLFVENEMGRVELGSNDGVGGTMRIGADSIARATGGIDGQWSNYVQLDTFQDTGANPYTQPAVQSMNNFITAPTLLTTSNQLSGALSTVVNEGDEKSRKITYYTPEFNGFQAGLSYTPDTRNSGQDYIDKLGQNVVNGITQPGSEYTLPTAKNAIAGGISWSGNLDKDQAFKLSVVGETATIKNNVRSSTKYKNVSGAIFGAQYAYQNFSVAGSWGTQGKSMYADTATSMKAGSFYTLGAAYVQGPVGSSLTWMKSTKNKNTLDLISLGLDYQVAPGLLPFAEVTYFKMKQKNSYNNSQYDNQSDSSTKYVPATNVAAAYQNSGTAFILGTKLKF